MSLKNPVTTPRIEPGTVRLVAQRLNHYANPGPCAYVGFLNKHEKDYVKVILLSLNFEPFSDLVNVVAMFQQ
jgi:hypothetical protein